MEPLQKYLCETRSLSTLIFPEGSSGLSYSGSYGADLLEGQFLQGQSSACSQELCTAPVDTLTCQSLPQHCSCTVMKEPSL